ncbi:hypothetical protein L7F22_031685 [Adiantum nelumboides]|nr:hypothetical protein [Adiantum nelumboides]
MSCQHVKFTPFEGDTYTHLKHFQLYTLTPDPDHPPQQQNSTEVIEQIHINPANVISESWKEDFKEVLEKFGRFTQGSSRDKMLPVILLRFGRILFHNRSGLFDWGSSHTPENLERNVKTKRLSKTFDVGLSRQQFVFLGKLARKDALHIQSEWKVTIQVADEMRPGSDLSCICYLLSEHNEQSVNPGKMDDQPEITGSVLELQKSVNPGKMDDQPEITGSVLELKKSVDPGNMDDQPEITGSVLELKMCVNPGKMDDQPEITGSAKYVLELKKVMLNPVRHMIGDISCGGKSCDIRLAFQIEEYPLLTEMELCDLKSIFNKASFDDTSFELPPYSTSGRFKFVGWAVERMRVVTGGELEWSFHSSRRSYQACVEPIICQELCEGRKEWDTEKAILCIQELLQRVWADCI